MIDENEKQVQLNALTGLSGLLSDLDRQEESLFDDIIKKRINLNNRTVDL